MYDVCSYYGIYMWMKLIMNECTSESLYVCGLWMVDVDQTGTSMNRQSWWEVFDRS